MFPLPEAPTELKIGEMAPMPLRQAHQLVWDNLMARVRANIEAKRASGGQEPDPQGEAAEAGLRRLLDRIISIENLAKLRVEAPAVFLLELSRLGGATTATQEEGQ